jgi:hypothetical protein
MPPNQPFNSQPPQPPVEFPVAPSPAPASAPENNPNPAPIPMPPNQPKKRLNVKVLAIAGVAAVVIAAAVFAYFAFFNKTTSDANEANLIDMFENTDKPILLKEDGKFGYISTKGEVLIEPKYQMAHEFYGDYARVSLDGKSQLIDKSGDVKMEAEKMLFHDNADVTVVDGVLYDSKLKRISDDNVDIRRKEGSNYWLYNNVAEDGKILGKGLLDSKGKAVYSCDAKQCDDIQVSIRANLNFFDETYVVIEQPDEAKYQIVNLKTKKVVYESTQAITNEDDNSFKIQNESGQKQLLFVRNDEIILTTDDTTAKYCESKGYYNLEDVCLYKNLIVYNDGSKKMAFDIDTKQVMDFSRPQRNPLNENKVYFYNVQDFNRLWRQTDYKFDFDRIREKYSDYTESLNIYALNPDVVKYFKDKKGQSLVYIQANGPKVGNEQKSHAALLDVDKMEEVVSFDGPDNANLSNPIYHIPGSILTGQSLASPFFVISIDEHGKNYGVLVHNLLTGKQAKFENLASEAGVTAYSNYITVDSSLDSDKRNQIEYYNSDLEKIYTVKE